jgi:Predicted membrane protein (DUF2306)
MKLFGTIWFYILAFGVAGYAVFAYGFMPLGSLVHPDMKLNFIAHKAGIYTHVLASLTLAAVTLRIYLPSSMIIGIPFELAYPVISWLCWVPNLLVAARLNSGVRPPSEICA